MTQVNEQDKAAFFKDVESAAKQAIWCALATVDGNEPRVRMVHPTWEDDVLWIATGPETAKARQIRSNGAVDIQFQVAPEDFLHLMVRGKAAVITDEATKRRVWDVMAMQIFICMHCSAFDDDEKLQLAVDSSKHASTASSASASTASSASTADGSDNKGKPPTTK